jgi:hypothetical protein
MPALSAAVVIGQGRPFIACLFNLRTAPGESKMLDVVSELAGNSVGSKVDISLSSPRLFFSSFPLLSPPSATTPIFHTHPFAFSFTPLRSFTDLIHPLNPLPQATTVKEAYFCPLFRTYLLNGISRCNARAHSKNEWVRSFVVVQAPLCGSGRHRCRKKCVSRHICAFWGGNAETDDEPD